MVYSKHENFTKCTRAAISVASDALGNDSNNNSRTGGRFMVRFFRGLGFTGAAIISLFLFASPVFASSHNYVCSDFSNKGGTPTPTCSSNILSYSISSGGGFASDPIPVYTLTTGGTYFITALFSVTSGTINYGGVNDCSFYNPVSATVNYSEHSFVAHQDCGGNGGFGTNVDGSSFTGSIGPICIDSDGTSCTAIVSTKGFGILTFFGWF